jgi:hypothetical protein
MLSDLAQDLIEEMSQKVKVSKQYIEEKLTPTVLKAQTSPDNVPVCLINKKLGGQANGILAKAGDSQYTARHYSDLEYCGKYG